MVHTKTGETMKYVGKRLDGRLYVRTMQGNWIELQLLVGGDV